MAKFALAPDDVVRVAHDRYHHPCPQILKRMEVRWLASHAKPTQEAVAELAGVVVSHIHQRTQADDAERPRSTAGAARGAISPRKTYLPRRRLQRLVRRPGESPTTPGPGPPAGG